jgi:hypothetical protein
MKRLSWSWVLIVESIACARNSVIHRLLHVRAIRSAESHITQPDELARCSGSYAERPCGRSCRFSRRSAIAAARRGKGKTAQNEHHQSRVITHGNPEKKTTKRSFAYLTIDGQGRCMVIDQAVAEVFAISGIVLVNQRTPVREG